MPFDSPSSARFLGTRLIVANQSVVDGDATHQALLDVEVGEPGLPELIPGRDSVAPTLSRVSVAPKRFAPVRKGGKRHRARRHHTARGARLKLRLSEAATVVVRVERKRGRKWYRVQSIEKSFRRGARSIGFNARLRSGRRTRAFPGGATASRSRLLTPPATARPGSSAASAWCAGARPGRPFRSSRPGPGARCCGRQPRGGHMEQRINLVTLGVRDVQRSKEFYERLGWEGRSPDGEVVFFQAGGMVFGLYARDKLLAENGVRAGEEGDAMTLGYIVGSPEEADALMADAEAAGARIGRPAEQMFWGGYSGTFLDPDGHAWEVAHNPGWTLNADGTISLD